MARFDRRGEYLLQRIRDICLPLPDVRETSKWGNPSFETRRKLFAVLDRYEGRWCLAFRANEELRPRLLQRDGFRPAPYSAKHGWVIMDTEGRVAWREAARLIEASYREVATR